MISRGWLVALIAVLAPTLGMGDASQKNQCDPAADASTVAGLLAGEGPGAPHTDLSCFSIDENFVLVGQDASGVFQLVADPVDDVQKAALAAALASSGFDSSRISSAIGILDWRSTCKYRVTSSPTNDDPVGMLGGVCFGRSNDWYYMACKTNTSNNDVGLKIQLDKYYFGENPSKDSLDDDQALDCHSTEIANRKRLRLIFGSKRMKFLCDMGRNEKACPNMDW